KRGFGSVGKFRWEQLDHDTSWLADESTLARVLPSRIVDELDIQPENAVPVLAQTIPPYRNQAQERCLMPAGLRTVRVNKAL
ncbi:hypothetical protein, partial [Priestia megaterium]|uniref:hypothetical protein n=1 Tax=Priestia megaterium TaxID=1404 RepID=UPI0035B60C2F